MRSRARFNRLSAAAMAAALLFGGSIGSVGAWGNNGDGYATHDWVLDQALRLLEARGVNTDWIDRTVALLATDDPDTVEAAGDPARHIEHIYKGAGLRGGAVHRITEHYAAILRLYAEGQAAKLAGDTTTALDRFRSASYNLGMLAHFYGDILQPFHTSRDANDAEVPHLAYELLVNTLTRRPTDSPDWSVANTDWQVKDMTNVRAAAIAAAAYSRQRYLTLAANFTADDDALSPEAAIVTREVLIRASGDLANLISSVAKGIGNPPPAGSLTISLRWRGVKANEKSEYVSGTVLDTAGKPIEGVRVDVTWPMPDGTTKILPFWTDELGKGHVYGIVGTNPMMAHQTVTANVTTNLASITKSTWFYRTPRLADGSAGFKTTVNDRTVHAGQTVTVTTLARTSTGSPVVGLLVTWTWKLGGTTVTTSGYTDSTGRARSTRTITSSTSRSMLYVTGKTSAYSISRSSTASFYRTD